VRDLELDAGYLSRILRRFETRAGSAREPSPHDARQHLLRLTEAGYATFAPLQQKSRDEAADMLATVPAAVRPRPDLRAADRAPPARATRARRSAGSSCAIRVPATSGWVVQTHGELYAREYGFDWTFEALVAQIAANFVKRFDADARRRGSPK
jgi:hypothetical protein